MLLGRHLIRGLLHALVTYYMSRLYESKESLLKIYVIQTTTFPDYHLFNYRAINQSSHKLSIILMKNGKTSAD